ncbi:MAG: hypothetical protein ACFBSD_01280 [Paracoccaceae bacterium]
MTRTAALVATLGLALVPANAPAFVPLDGYFIALDACPAGMRIDDIDDPGMPETVVRRAYDILGKNKADHTHFQIRMPQTASGRDRWVEANCGVHVKVATPSGTPQNGNGPFRNPPATVESTENLLTASWQPAFCETKPGKDECEALNDGNLPVAVRQFSIHGLWPQPNGFFYCGVPENVARKDKSSTWHQLPAPQVDAETAGELAVAMPGVASHLHHHEWIKHGTCYLPAAFGTAAADEYYDDTLWLMGELNGSEVGALFEANVGQFLSGAEIRAAFDASFGAGAGDRVRIACVDDRDSGRELVGELWIHLRGTISPDADMGALIRAADPVDMDCDGGIVDPAGNQRF